MRPTLPSMLAAAVAAVLLGCAASAQQPVSVPAPAVSAGNTGAGDLLQRLRALEAASTCNAPSDCRAVPVGARLCGGPAAWLAISSAKMGEAAPLAERYTAQRKAANEAAASEGRVGTCQVVVEPAIGCVSGQCRAISSGPSGRAD